MVEPFFFQSGTLWSAVLIWEALSFAMRNQCHTLSGKQKEDWKAKDLQPGRRPQPAGGLQLNFGGLPASSSLRAERSIAAFVTRLQSQATTNNAMPSKAHRTSCHTLLNVSTGSAWGSLMADQCGRYQAMNFKPNSTVNPKPATVRTTWA